MTIGAVFAASGVPLLVPWSMQSLLALAATASTAPFAAVHSGPRHHTPSRVDRLQPAAPHVVFLLADVRPGVAASVPLTRVLNTWFVVCVHTQDFGFADIGYRPGTDVRTPHLDALASAGVKLDAMYTQLVCSPSRGAIMTGKFPYRLGLSHGFIAAGAPYGMPLSETTIAQEMAAHGWSCHMVGKCE